MAGKDHADLDSVTAKLVARYGDVLPPTVVAKVVEESYDSLRTGARITAYLAVLAERAAADRLAQLREGVRRPAQAGSTDAPSWSSAVGRRGQPHDAVGRCSQRLFRSLLPPSQEPMLPYDGGLATGPTSMSRQP